MTQGKFSKEEAKECHEALDEIMKAMPKSKTMEFVGHFNDIFLFLGACQRECPSELIEDKKMTCGECGKKEANYHECYNCYVEGWIKQKPKVIKRVYNDALKDVIKEIDKQIITQEEFLNRNYRHDRAIEWRIEGYNILKKKILKRQK